jgi:hypothetical protein
LIIAGKASFYVDGSKILGRRENSISAFAQTEEGERCLVRTLLSFGNESYNCVMTARNSLSLPGSTRAIGAVDALSVAVLLAPDSFVSRVELSGADVLVSMASATDASGIETGPSGADVFSLKSTDVAGVPFCEDATIVVGGVGPPWTVSGTVAAVLGVAGATFVEPETVLTLPRLAATVLVSGS